MICTAHTILCGL